MKLFRTFRRTVQYPILVWTDLLLPGEHFEFQNLLARFPNNPILLNVIQNLGRIVSTEDIIQKIL